MPKLKTTAVAEKQKTATKKVAKTKSSKIDEIERKEMLLALKSEETMAMEELRLYYQSIRRYISKGYRNTYRTAGRHKRAVTGSINDTHHKFKPSNYPPEFFEVIPHKAKNKDTHTNNLKGFIKK